mmetsp:Transcript_327/g.585  ORF Transcript_327/g.585 Transcript_327/m.585 type:complete len:189 (+) Transcript_327:155-721(+)
MATRRSNASHNTTHLAPFQPFTQPNHINHTQLSDHEDDLGLNILDMHLALPLDKRCMNCHRVIWIENHGTGNLGHDQDQVYCGQNCLWSSQLQVQSKVRTRTRTRPLVKNEDGMGGVNPAAMGMGLGLGLGMSYSKRRESNGSENSETQTMGDKDLMNLSTSPGAKAYDADSNAMFLYHASFMHEFQR